MWTTSGVVARSISAKSEKHSKTPNRSPNCLAINNSRSQRETIWQSGIRRIAKTCWSAILPQPAIAMRSIVFRNQRSEVGSQYNPCISALSAVRIRFKLAEERFHRFTHRYAWLPAQPVMKFLIRVTVSFPLGSAAAAVESRRKLALGRIGIFLPEETEQVSDEIRNRGGKSVYPLFVQPQKLSAGEKVVIYNIENLSVDTGLETSEHNGLRAVIDKGHRQSIGSAEMDEEPKRVDAYAAV